MQHSRLRFARIFIITLSLVMVACSSSQRIVKTYEGETLPDDQLAKLKAPEDVEIVEIDGVAQKTYLLDNLSLTYSLLPGEHTITYRYSSIWSRRKKSDDADEPSVDVIKSDLQQVTMLFQPGQSYSFRFPRPANKREAAVLAPDFTAAIVDSTGSQVAEGIPFTAGATIGTVADAGSGFMDQGEVGGGPETTPPLNDRTSQLATENAGSTKDTAANPQKLPPVEAGFSRLDAIKVLWSRATADEKKEFLRWAFQ